MLQPLTQFPSQQPIAALFRHGGQQIPCAQSAGTSTYPNAVSKTYDGLNPGVPYSFLLACLGSCLQRCSLPLTSLLCHSSQGNEGTWYTGLANILHLMSSLFQKYCQIFPTHLLRGSQQQALSTTQLYQHPNLTLCEVTCKCEYSLKCPIMPGHSDPGSISYIISKFSFGGLPREPGHSSRALAPFSQAQWPPPQKEQPYWDGDGCREGQRILGTEVGPTVPGLKPGAAN